MDAVSDRDTVGVAGVFDLDHLPLARHIGSVEPLGDHAVEARALERAEPLRAQLGILGRPGDMTPLLLGHRIRQRLPPDPERLAHQRHGTGGQCVESDEMRGGLLGEHPHPALGRMDALAERLPIQPDAATDLARDDHLAVEHAPRGGLVAQRVHQLGEVPAEFLAIARLQHHLVAVAEHQRPEAVPLRLIGPHPRVVGHLRLGLGEHGFDRW